MGWRGTAARDRGLTLESKCKKHLPTAEGGTPAAAIDTVGSSVELRADVGQVGEVDLETELVPRVVDLAVEEDLVDRVV